MVKEDLIQFSNQFSSRLSDSEFTTTDSIERRIQVESPINRMSNSYVGSHLAFSISDFGEVIPFQYPVGNEHLNQGNLVSGYNLMYDVDGVTKNSHAYYESRLNINSGEYFDEIDGNILNVSVIVRTSDELLEIERTFQVNLSEKSIQVETTLTNISDNEISNMA